MSAPTPLPTGSNLRLSVRFADVGFSEIVRIRNRVLELKAAGETIHQFEGGEPFFETPEPIKEAMRRALAENKTRYAPSSGIPPLIEAIVDKVRAKNGIPAEPAHVVVGVGGMQGLYGAFNALLDPGDEVLLPSPYWTPTRDLIHMTGGRAVCVEAARMRAEGIETVLRARLTPRTRAILVNSPNNPTGQVLTRADLEAIAGFAQRHDLVVVSDEAYEDLVYEGEHISIASLPGMYARTISVYTLSKSYGMTGWRLGYAVAPEPFITGIKTSVLYSTNGVSTPTQWAALAALRDVPASFFEECRAAYRQRRDRLIAGLAELGLPVKPVPAGAFYVFPDVSALGEQAPKLPCGCWMKRGWRPYRGRPSAAPVKVTCV
ncbi:pyridoxal phosphate-dependent aminotransferase [Chloracidobacterium thermophilum]|uniref:pyridoxal phosphate-dependent aminotransferase n=1 Tax=Chloracidobacterium thermophilum TaxID=458033 RepID=UPI0020182DAA|nr:aminotransferase class I/II-fold pyridoxal phosphate-dependent enzyme [Chloracidobacterium thermophilum]